MSVCAQCGHHNEDDDAFCGSCGEYLEWEGTTSSAPAGDLVEEEAPPADDEDGKGLIGRVVERLTGPGTASGPADEGAPVDQEGGTAGDANVATVDLTTEAGQRAELEAARAERARIDAETRAAEEAEAAETARRQAEEAEDARHRAEEQARAEADDAARLRAQLEAAEASRQAAEAELARERQQLEAELAREREELEAARSASAQAQDEARRAAEETVQRSAEDAERTRQEAEERLRAEQEAVAQARAQLEEAEAARAAAEAHARAEREEAEVATRRAAEAEQARIAAEARAAEEAAAAERARRAAALVAKPRPTAPRAPAAAAAATTAPAKRASTRRGPAATAPAAPSTPTARAPKAVKPTPTRQRPAPRNRSGPSRTIRPGDLICGRCGEGNDPSRNFCRRCGDDLKEATVQRVAWWRRLVPRRRRLTAGERPRRLRGKGRGAAAGARNARRKARGALGLVGRATAVLAIIGIGTLGLGPWRATIASWSGDQLQAARRIIAPQFDPVTALAADASSQRSDHPASHAVDGLSNTWWATAGGGGVDEFLLVTFGEPVDIAALGILPGAADAAEFAAQPRPAALHLLFDNGVAVDLDVADGQGFQSFNIAGADGVTSVEVRVTRVYPGQSGTDLSITELEFRTKR
jgi:hypothetical protein